MEETFDIAIVGGLGHVGLPLGLAFANKSQKVLLLDIDAQKAETVNKGIMPFTEEGADELLKKVVGKNLFATVDKTLLKKAKFVIIAIGTPVDEYLNPKTRAFMKTMESLLPYLADNQTLIIRSTVYPKTCQQVYKWLKTQNGPQKLAYCPERIVQGFALRELKNLPQVISGTTEEAANEAENLFRIITDKTIRTSLEEAELVKLFCNSWRYIQFAVANQFFMICSRFGVDYERVRRAMSDGYSRAAQVPGAGFAAGPCLLKDTMQLAAFSENNFQLGHAAMVVNEGLPNFIVEQLRRKYDFDTTKIGILGMAFKADVDDIRDSLSYKLGKLLRFHGANVSYADEFVQDPTFITKEEMVKTCDVVVVATPHTAYKNFEIPESVDLIDIWNVSPRGRTALAAATAGLQTTDWSVPKTTH